MVRQKRKDLVLTSKMRQIPPGEYIARGGDCEMRIDRLYKMPFGDGEYRVERISETIQCRDGEMVVVPPLVDAFVFARRATNRYASLEAVDDE